MVKYHFDESNYHVFKDDFEVKFPKPAGSHFENMATGFLLSWQNLLLNFTLVIIDEYDKSQLQITKNEFYMK